MPSIRPLAAGHFDRDQQATASLKLQNAGGGSCLARSDKTKHIAAASLQFGSEHQHDRLCSLACQHQVFSYERLSCRAPWAHRNSRSHGDNSPAGEVQHTCQSETACRALVGFRSYASRYWPQFDLGQGHLAVSVAKLAIGPRGLRCSSVEDCFVQQTSVWYWRRLPRWFLR